MKYWLLALCVALLSACGGGGGGAVSMELQTDSATLMSQLSDARAEIAASIPADKRAEFENKIAALEQDLNAARASVAELSAQLMAILEEMRNIAIPPDNTPTATDCHADNKILANDRCQNCATGEQFNSATNTCEDIPPTATECYAEEKVLVGDRCQSCATGEQFNSATNTCEDIPPTATDCHADNKILANDRCQSCATGEQFNSATNTCEDIPPTAAECYADDKILVDDRCQSCPPNQQVNTTINACEDIPPTAAECRADNKILVDDRCQSCPPNMAAGVNRCVDTAATFNTAEYRRNPMYKAIKPLYAYQHGYFGQGVTVAVIEYRTDFNVKHPDLAANYVTVAIDGISHSRVTHQIIPNTPSNRAEDDHSSRVAGLIGAVRNGNGMHGIAPEVKMIPFSSAERNFNNGVRVDNQQLVGQYIRENNIPIVNNSYGSGGRPLSVMLTHHLEINDANEHNDAVGDADTIWVWAAGNDGWHVAPNIRPDRSGLVPFFHERLKKNWVVAIAIDPYNIYHEYRIAGYSNACGAAKDWCVATAVYDAYTPNHDEEKDEYGYISGGFGTSFAAPQVSGALAILYGAIGIESPKMARAILLTTTTDLGEPGIDDIYGHGLVNISAAIVVIENMKTKATDELDAVPFANLRGELPSGFSHLHDELAEVQVAIKLTNGLHYNVALSEMMIPGDDSDVPLGDGATDMLADAESDSRRGFFAYGDMDAELGLRYYGGEGGFSYVAEGQHAKTNQRFFSGNFGALGGVSGKVYSGKVGFTRDMDITGMQIFGDYERAAVGGDGDEGNLIVGVRDAQAESWMAGISFGDIWKYGDKIKLSARQEMGLSGGDLIVRYPHAVGDFHETFIGEGTQEIEVREAFLPLKQKALMLYTAGYAQQFTAKSEWAAALEYNAGNNAKALSLIWQGEF